jgi:hypothetical protein
MMDGSTARPAAGRGFRITATVLAVLLILLTVPFAVSSMISSDPEQTIHRFHNTGGSVPTLILAAALVLVGWRPGDVAGMQLFVLGAIVSAVVGLVAGDLFTGLQFVGVVLAAILLALYPARADVWRARSLRPTLLAVALIAAVPAVAYALTQASFQRHGTSLDVHAQMHHYSGSAVAALALPATVLVAAVGGAGWRAVGWIGAAAFVVFGVSALAYSTYVSAPDPVWSWASIVGGIVVLALTELEARRPTGRPT